MRASQSTATWAALNRTNQPGTPPRSQATSNWANLGPLGPREQQNAPQTQTSLGPPRSQVTINWAVLGPLGPREHRNACALRRALRRRDPQKRVSPSACPSAKLFLSEWALHASFFILIKRVGALGTCKSALGPPPPTMPSRGIGPPLSPGTSYKGEHNLLSDPPLRLGKAGKGRAGRGRSGAAPRLGRTNRKTQKSHLGHPEQHPLLLTSQGQVGACFP